MAGLALFTLSSTSIQTACHSLLISFDVFLSFRNSFCRVVIQKKNPLTKHPAEEMPFNSKCLFAFSLFFLTRCCHLLLIDIHCSTAHPVFSQLIILKKFFSLFWFARKSNHPHRMDINFDLRTDPTFTFKNTCGFLPFF